MLGTVRYNVHCMKKIFSATEARKQFFKILELAGKPGATITITLAGRLPVVVMPLEDFQKLQEMLIAIGHRQGVYKRVRR